MLLIDAHVHIHACYDISIFLKSVSDNFKCAVGRMPRCECAQGVLLLSEARTDSFFEQLTDTGVRLDPDNSPTRWTEGWIFEGTGEDCSVFAKNAEQDRVLIVAGRQVVTREGLEVLALGTAWRFEDGKPLQVILEEVKDSGGIPVIPWGFGKWTGKRGRLLARLLSTATSDTGLFLGDNSGRPFFLRQPQHFELAERKGIRILPGSDPLPFVSEISRAGSFGFMVDGKLDLEHPAEDIKKKIRGNGFHVHRYGEMEGVWRFVRNQVRMQMVKHARRWRDIGS